MRPLLFSTALLLAACGGAEADDGAVKAGMDVSGMTAVSCVDKSAIEAANPGAKIDWSEDFDGGVCCPDALQLSLSAYSDAAQPGESDDFFAVNGERDDVVATESGLQYRVVQSGLEDAPKPGLNQKTKVLYHGTYLDGETFDSAYDRGVPIEFAPSGVIAGWTEALTDMKVCEARTLYVPYDLAYGADGGRGIPPKADLVFNVQVLGVR